MQNELAKSSFSSLPVQSSSGMTGSLHQEKKSPDQSGGCQPGVLKVEVDNKLPEGECAASAPVPRAKNVKDFKISNSSDIQKRQIIKLKNKFFTKYCAKMPSETVRDMMNDFKNDDYVTVLKLASCQDNNERYFDQLKALDLPCDYHSIGYDEYLRAFRAMDSKGDRSAYFRSAKFIMFSEAADASRLESEFGLYFTPSSVWLTPVAEKLKSLGCKTGIEVMAGKGYLSYFLQTYGFKMKASDSQESYQRYTAYSDPITVRKEDSLKTVKKFKESADFLVISWPPNIVDESVLDPPADYQMLTEWGVKKPVLFVGERPDENGVNLATGSMAFHHHLDLHFTACQFPQYKGRSPCFVDEAIIFIPNKK